MARRHKVHPLQSRSEIVLRNTVVAGLIAFFSVFYLIPILMAFVGSFHLWNPLEGTVPLYRPEKLADGV